MVKPDAYGCVNTNYDLLHFYNSNTPDNKGKKVLLIRDSYSNYLSAFLANDLEYLDAINYGFNGSKRTYIKENRPDAVIIILYSHRYNFDWDSYDDRAFDLR